MRRPIILRTLIAIIFGLISFQSANADIPEIISYQGILSDSTGSPLTGDYNITVSIYDQESGGVALWSETHANVVVSDGKFNIMMGSVASLSDSLDFEVPYWLGVSIGGGAELTPRTQFASTATAFAAQKVLERILPAGMVAPFAMGTPPSGWLECKGQAVSRENYADLFAAIDTMYGAGNGSTTFNLPDYRGYFLRGWDRGANRDPDRSTRTDRGDGTTGNAVGTRQGDEFKSHTHSQKRATWGYPEYIDSGNNLTIANAGTTGASGGNETRPKNVTVMYCIKY